MAMTSGPVAPPHHFFNKNSYRRPKKKAPAKKPPPPKSNIIRPPPQVQNVISHRTVNNTAPRDIPYSPPIRKQIAKKIRGEFGRSFARGKKVLTHTAKVLNPAIKVGWPVAKAFYHLASDNPPAFVRDVFETAGAIPGAAFQMGRNFYQDMVRDMHYLKMKYWERYAPGIKPTASEKRMIESQPIKRQRLLTRLPDKKQRKRRIRSEIIDKHMRLNDDYPEIEVLEESDIEFCVC